MFHDIVLINDTIYQKSCLDYLSLKYINCGTIKFKGLNFMVGFTFHQQFFFLNITIIISQYVFYHNSSELNFVTMTSFQRVRLSENFK